MRIAQTAPLTGLFAQVMLIAGLAVTVGLGGAGFSPAGWVVGVACGVVTNAALAGGLSHYRANRLSPADWVTLGRATLAVGVAALVADSFAEPAPITLLVSLAAVALALDAVDGWVARRTRTAGILGARFDGEVDAFLILVLSVYVSRSAGVWVLAIGAARYAFLVAGWPLRWLRDPLPPRQWRKVVAATQGVVLIVAAANVLPPALTRGALIVALVLLAESFGRDVWWLRSHRLADDDSVGVVSPVAPGATFPRQRIAGLDGIRGLAALFVVINHVFLRAFPGYPVDHAPVWAAWFIYGRFAVVVFIVLSGFSLAVSPARHGWHLDGIRTFARRRARRILPAYWAALVFSLVVAWLVVPQPGQGVPGVGSVAVNGLLVQNLVGVPSPNRAFWSMAVEAQLYLAFPLLLLLVRRRGAIVMLAMVTVLVAAVGIIGPHIPRLDTFVIQSPPDLAALFALGILTAGIVQAGSARRSWPWPWLALGAAAPVLATICWQGSVWTLGHLFWVDLALGPAIACLLAALATGRPARLLRLLDARPLRALGDSSYSLYLTHAPIVAVVSGLIVAGRVSPGVPTFLVSLALVLPLTIMFARVFASVFERRLRQPRSLVRPARPEPARVAGVAG